VAGVGAGGGSAAKDPHGEAVSHVARRAALHNPAKTRFRA
jgi:hypothetical protein